MSEKPASYGANNSNASKSREKQTMINLKTPNNIEVLLHCHCTNEVHPRIDAPAVIDALAFLYERELIIMPNRDSQIYRTTKKGAFHVQALCNLPLPVSQWVTPQGEQ